MAAKAPIYLKRGSRKGKKEKLRDLLSSDMISPPLGDFRHTIHIGAGGRGDMFGDVSFLQGKFHLLPRPQSGFGSENCGFGSENRDFGSESDNVAAFTFARAATVSGREAPSSEAASPLLKNAISLPLIEGLQAVSLPSAPPKPPRLHLDDKIHENAWETPEENRRGPRDASFSPPRSSGGTEQAFLPPAGSLLSLHVDLGPSILDDVLRVMEKHQAEGGRTSRQELLT